MRLEDYKRQYAPPAPPPPVKKGGKRIEDLLPGEVRTHRNGSCFVVQHRYGPEHRHGGRSLHLPAPAEALAVACRDPELRYLDLRRAVFLDTETTGLGMGVGTYVFLVGAGYVDRDGFTVRQFFLPGPEDEPAFLAELRSFLSRFQAIVTFNGKAFDWPVLENRFIYQRETPPFYDPPHLDLLHPARRLWKRRLPSCALSSLESHVLGVERTEEDVPGYLIPALYFQYQSTGDGGALRRVFYHNLHDVLSLAALGSHIGHLIHDPLSGTVREAADFFSLARLFEQEGDVSRALLCYDEALRAATAPNLQSEILVGLALAHKRERHWEAAMQAWDRLLDHGGWHALFARVEYAKYYEHVERDYDLAIDHTESAITMAELHDASWPELARRELEHRLARLLNRAARAHGRVLRGGKV